MTGFYFGQKMARGCAELAMKKRSHDYFTGVNLRCGPEDWAQLRGRGGGGGAVRRSAAKSASTGSPGVA